MHGFPIALNGPESTRLKEQVIEYLSDRIDCEIIFSVEDKPLGTGGAIKNTKKNIVSNNFFVINGDSYFDVNFNSMITSHKNYNGLITIGLSKLTNNEDYGGVLFNESFRITSFSEKSLSNSEYVNAGIYLFHKPCKI